MAAVLAEALHVRATDPASGGVPKALVRVLLPHMLYACAAGGPVSYCLEWKE